MKRVFVLLTLLISASLVPAQDITGDWQGTLNTGIGELRLVLHVTKVADGSLKATLDSVDQAANGIPVNSTTLKGSKLSLDVTAVHGAYEGSVTADGETISGIWSQSGKDLPLDFKRATNPIKTEHKPARPSDIDGSWMGSLDTGSVTLRIVFHIVNTEDGLIATMDSPDQDMKGMPTTSVGRDGSSLRIEAKSIGGMFEGRIAADLSSIDGNWSQGGATLPLLLNRVRNRGAL